MKTVVTIPARNSAKMLKFVYKDIPKKYRKSIVLSDDSSKDKTAEAGKKLGMIVSRNPRKPGYGSNVKNCFKNALKLKAGIIVVLHADNQYDATKIPAMSKLIEDNKADFVIGSRILGDKAKGMSFFRFSGNRFLGFMENLIMGTKITDLHSGLIAVRADYLRKIPYLINSDDYGFHTDLVLQYRFAGARFREVGIPTRYEEISTSISVYKSIVYGFSTVFTLSRYALNKIGIIRTEQFRTKKD